MSGFEMQNNDSGYQNNSTHTERADRAMYICTHKGKSDICDVEAFQPHQQSRYFEQPNDICPECFHQSLKVDLGR